MEVYFDSEETMEFLRSITDESCKEILKQERDKKDNILQDKTSIVVKDFLTKLKSEYYKEMLEKEESLKDKILGAKGITLAPTEHVIVNCPDIANLVNMLDKRLSNIEKILNNLSLKKIN